jgi:hypothetical protein
LAGQQAAERKPTHDAEVEHGDCLEGQQNDMTFNDLERTVLTQKEDAWIKDRKWSNEDTAAHEICRSVFLHLFSGVNYLVPVFRDEGLSCSISILLWKCLFPCPCFTSSATMFQPVLHFISHHVPACASLHQPPCSTMFQHAQTFALMDFNEIQSYMDLCRMMLAFF